MVIIGRYVSTVIVTITFILYRNMNIFSYFISFLLIKCYFLKKTSFSINSIIERTLTIEIFVHYLLVLNCPCYRIFKKIKSNQVPNLMVELHFLFDNKVKATSHTFLLLLLYFNLSGSCVSLQYYVQVWHNMGASAPCMANTDPLCECGRANTVGGWIVAFAHLYLHILT